MRKYTLISLTTLTLLTACANPQHTNVAAGTAVGAVVGAGVGNLISKNSKGTAIGALVGAGVGAGIGHHFGDRIRQMLSGLPPESGVTVENTQPNQPNSPVVITLPEKVTFNTNSAVLKTDNLTQVTLGKIVQAIQAQNYTNIIVAGHADITGDAGKNQELSLQRAVSVANYLTRSGVDSRKVRAEGKGAREPIADNSTAYGRAQNRRVEITVYPM